MNIRLPLLFTFADQAVISGSNLILGIVLVRSMGFTTYGVFVIIWALAQLGQLLSICVISSPASSIYPHLNNNDAADYISANYTLALLLPCVIGATFFVVDYAAKPFPNSWWDHAYIMPLCAWTAALQFLDNFRRLLHIRGRRDIAIATSICAYPCQIVLVLIFKPKQLDQVIYLISLSICLGGLSGIVLYRPCFSNIGSAIAALQRNLNVAKWLVAGTLLQWICANSLLVTAGTLFGLEIPGKVRAVQNLVGVLGTAFQAIDTFLSVESAKVYARLGTYALSKYLVKWASVIFFVTCGILIFICIFSREIFEFFYKTTDVDILSTTIWLGLFYTLSSFSISSQAWLKTKERTRPVFIGYLLTTIFVLTVAPIIMTSSAKSVIIMMIVGQAIFQIPQCIVWARGFKRD